MIDYHIHTHLCKHATGDIEAYIRRAIEAGFLEIAFTDHIPLPHNFDHAHRMAPFEMEKYQQLIYKARNDFPEIRILFGIEADYFHGLESYLSEFLAKYDFDVVIMSVHFIPSWPAGNWVFGYNFPDKEQSEIFTEYIDVMTSGIETGLFDVIGHADIIKRPGESLLTTIPDKVTQLFRTIKRSGMAIEFNTSGMRKVVGESYPDPAWLPSILEHNIPVTLGSDAHTPEQVGYKFDKMIEILKHAGIRQLARYDQRVPGYYLL